MRSSIGVPQVPGDDRAALLEQHRWVGGFHLHYARGSILTGWKLCCCRLTTRASGFCTATLTGTCSWVRRCTLPHHQSSHRRLLPTCQSAPPRACTTLGPSRPPLCRPDGATLATAPSLVLPLPHLRPLALPAVVEGSLYMAIHNISGQVRAQWDDVLFSTICWPWAE